MNPSALQLVLGCSKSKTPKKRLILWDFSSTRSTFQGRLQVESNLQFSFSLSAGWERGRKRRRKRHTGFIWLLSTAFSCHPWRPASSERTAKHHVHTALKTSSLAFQSASRRKRRVCLSDNTQTDSLSHKQTHPRWLYVSFHIFIYCETCCLQGWMWKNSDV